MNLLHDDAPLALVVLGWAVVIPAVALSLLAVRRRFLPSSLAEHAWLAATVATAFVWALHVRSPVGLDFGLLGGALFTLVYGRARAILGLLCALALHTLMTSGSWLNFGITGSLLAVVPACAASLLQRLIERWLPRNIFVFIVGNGLFVTLVVTALADALLLAAGLTGAQAAPRQLNEHIAYSLLLAWGEALVSGMIFSALVVFLPQAVLTYRQDIYLPPRRPSV
ncbi:MAG TPA: energy-coupling factor ABC transporter permease [Burkholderiaceae bacterium]|nr:energy-coupling factor ABC transporter permease [Burkholderiaceae bacterium]